jgi:hypothetical protein
MTGTELYQNLSIRQPVEGIGLRSERLRDELRVPTTNQRCGRTAFNGFGMIVRIGNHIDLLLFNGFEE